MQHRSQVCALGISLTLVLLASVGHSAGKPKAAPRPEGYGYQFDDDPLLAGGVDASGPRIEVMRRSFRETLIRPRTAFVVEMLRSVESL